MAVLYGAPWMTVAHPNPKGETRWMMMDESKTNTTKYHKHGHALKPIMFFHCIPVSSHINVQLWKHQRGIDRYLLPWCGLTHSHPRSCWQTIPVYTWVSWRLGFHLSSATTQSPSWVIRPVVDGSSCCSLVGEAPKFESAYVSPIFPKRSAWENIRVSPVLE